MDQKIVEADDKGSALRTHGLGDQAYQGSSSTAAPRAVDVQLGNLTSSGVEGVPSAFILYIDVVISAIGDPLADIDVVINKRRRVMKGGMVYFPCGRRVRNMRAGSPSLTKSSLLNRASGG